MKVIGAVAIVTGSFFATMAALDMWWPAACSGPDRIDLKKPFQNSSGFAYVAPTPQFSSVSNNMQQLTRSPLKLCENGTPIGPPHIALAEIASDGRGRFVHWGDNVFFSASDSSNPNTNGRSYSVGP
ncbi:MAG: uncharacterized protein JWR80_5121 [Bradyrhizobium sp.]|nr:uncharacterized protein [Bradyrhizobium sp.]